jgi:hypothetical protein
MANPYSEEPYLTVWDQGHEYGAANPSDTDPTPPDYASWGYDETTTGYIVTVWREGVLAGSEEASAGGGYEEGSEDEEEGGLRIEIDEFAIDGGEGELSVSEGEFDEIALADLPGNVEGVDYSLNVSTEPAAEGEAEGESEEAVS